MACHSSLLSLPQPCVTGDHSQNILTIINTIGGLASGDPDTFPSTLEMRCFRLAHVHGGRKIVHRAIVITMPPVSTNELIRERLRLEKSDHLISLSVHRGASIKPPGDVLMVHALNRDADRVMQLVDEARVEGEVSVTTHELSSIVDPEHEQAVANDYDEALWEESEINQGRPTAN